MNKPTFAQWLHKEAPSLLRLAATRAHASGRIAAWPNGDAPNLWTEVARTLRGDAGSIAEARELWSDYRATLGSTSPPGTDPRSATRTEPKAVPDKPVRQRHSFADFMASRLTPVRNTGEEFRLWAHARIEAGTFPDRNASWSDIRAAALAEGVDRSAISVGRQLYWAGYQQGAGRLRQGLDDFPDRVPPRANKLRT